jgi:hypothetical protein
VIHELHRLVEFHVREQRPGEVIVVPPADVCAVELLGDGNAVVETDLKRRRPLIRHNIKRCRTVQSSSGQSTEMCCAVQKHSSGEAMHGEQRIDSAARGQGTHLLQKLAEGEEVDGIGVAEGAVDVEQDGLQRRHLRQSSEFRVETTEQMSEIGVTVPIACYNKGQEQMSHEQVSDQSLTCPPTSPPAPE